MRRTALFLTLSLSLASGVARAAHDARAERAAAWSRTQRAFPAADIPPGAYAHGREALRALRKKPRPAGPSGSWQFIGPAPVDTTVGGLETPNMSPSAGRASAVAVDPTDSNTIYAGYSLGG